jgi:2-oxoglutarate ferredoxin oxidoreductase subunit beta
MMRQLKENSVSLAAADKLSPEERDGKIVRGVLHNIDKPEYSAVYDQLIERAQGGA